MSKGSARRPGDDAAFAKNYARIFGGNRVAIFGGSMDAQADGYKPSAIRAAEEDCTRRQVERGCKILDALGYGHIGPRAAEGWVATGWAKPLIIAPTFTELMVQIGAQWA